MVQVNEDGLKLNGTRQIQVYGDENNKLGASLLNIKKKAETLLVGREEIGLEVNADKNKQHKPGHQLLSVHVQNNRQTDRAVRVTSRR